MQCIALLCIARRKGCELNAQVEFLPTVSRLLSIHARHAEPPRDMSEEDEDLIGSGKALELLEVWQGVFKGTRLVKAGGLHKPFLACCVAREHTPRVPLPAIYWDVRST